MPEPLTETERRVYHYLIDFLAEHTYQPSVRDIARHFGIRSTKTVSKLLQALTRKGYIERDPARSRGVRILGFSGAVHTQPVPYFGRVAAGPPSLLAEDREGFITMDRRFLPSEDAFFIRAEGDSMTERGICDGDYVMICPTPCAAEGDIVAARIGTQATIKTLSHDGDQVVLLPARTGAEPLRVPRDADFEILGRVCAIFRSLVGARAEGTAGQRC
ncbi:MAG TPA: transcriptional repressor LexA [Gemmatimonadaceae bacterium]|nr:transcriptional repressor LexA [Gemmatimonadaceae bacterium]